MQSFPPKGSNKQRWHGFVVSCSMTLAFIAAFPAMSVAQQVVPVTPVVEPPSSDTSGFLTADGRYVLFNTSQSLSPDDTNSEVDAYVRDMQDGTVTRVSVGPNGSHIPEGAWATAFSSDGRFVLLSTNAPLVPQAPTTCARPFGSLDTRPCFEIYMHDRQTHEITLVSQSTEGVAANADNLMTTMSDDGRFVLFASYATNLAPGAPSPVRDRVMFLRDRTAGTTSLVTVPNVGPAEAWLRDAIISRDGNSIFYAYRGAAAVMGRSTGATQVLDIPPPPEISGIVSNLEVADISADGRFVLLFREVISDDPARTDHAEFLFHDRQQSRTVTLAGCCRLESVNPWGRLRADGQQVVYQDVVRLPGGESYPTLRMYDDRSRQTFELAGVSTFPPENRGLTGTRMGAIHFSADGSRVSFRVYGAVAGYGGATGSRLFSFRIDSDGDELPDRWENQFGLDPHASADATADADGDGVTNLEEFRSGTHPRALFTRYLAEGVSNAVFSTRLALVNPGSAPAAVMLRYQAASGALAAPSTMAVVPPMSRVTIDPAPMPGIAVADFSTLVESDAMVVVDRTTNVHVVGHGAATETAFVQPSTTWYFAEGATGGPFSLFYQLQNPGDIDAQVSVTYLMPAPQPPLTKSYTVNARSRFTIPVDSEDPLLASADVSARIVSDRPIVAERAMYLDSLNQPFGAVIGGAGVTTPATRWFLAEGATGSFFDLYVLIGNPGTTDANVSLTYLLPDGTHFTKTYLSPAQSRLTIQVDYEDPRLKDTPVSIVVDSAGVPVVVERTMWWPEGRWYEGHLSVASQVTSKKWVLAEGEVDTFHHVQTYLQIANTSPTPGVATIRWLLDADVGSAAATTVALPPNSRTNVPVTVGMLPRRYPYNAFRFGAVIESDGVELIVERSMYRDIGGVIWAAGTNALATPIP